MSRHWLRASEYALFLLRPSLYWPCWLIFKKIKTHTQTYRNNSLNCYRAVNIMLTISAPRELLIMCHIGRNPFPQYFYTSSIIRALRGLHEISRLNKILSSILRSYQCTAARTWIYDFYFVSSCFGVWVLWSCTWPSQTRHMNWTAISPHGALFCHVGIL